MSFIRPLVLLYFFCFHHTILAIPQQDIPCTPGTNVYCENPLSASSSVTTPTPFPTAKPTAPLFARSLTQSPDACLTFPSLYSSCSAATPNFDPLPTPVQASCMCYSGTAWAPNALDVPFSDCYASATSAGTLASSDLAPLGAFLRFCQTVGNVRHAAQTVGGAPGGGSTMSTGAQTTGDSGLLTTSAGGDTTSDSGLLTTNASAQPTGNSTVPTTSASAQSTGSSGALTTAGSSPATGQASVVTVTPIATPTPTPTARSDGGKIGEPRLGLSVYALLLLMGFCVVSLCA